MNVAVVCTESLDTHHTCDETQRIADNWSAARTVEAVVAQSSLHAAVAGVEIPQTS